MWGAEENHGVAKNVRDLDAQSEMSAKILSLKQARDKVFCC